MQRLGSKNPSSNPVQEVSLINYRDLRCLDILPDCTNPVLTPIGIQLCLGIFSPKRSITWLGVVV